MSKNVIVFGGSGFIGSHVCDVLSDQGYRVTIFDAVSSPYLRAEQSMVVGDILDAKKVSSAIAGHEIVINFAGIADIDECKRRPIDAVKLNVLGNTIVLEGCIKNSVKRYLFASSAYVYGSSGAIYRDTKQACELLVDTYHKEFGLDYTILRYGSLYGLRSDERNSIYRIIKQALQSGKISYRGTGEEIREYIHVYDAARLTLQVLGDEFKNQHIVLTGSQTMKYKDLLNMVSEMLDNRVKIEYHEREENSAHYRVTPYAFKPRLGRKLVGNPYVDFGEGILELFNELHEELHPDGAEESGPRLENE